MTRVLILGGLGMLGHELARTLAGHVEVCAAIRRPTAAWPATLPRVMVTGSTDLLAPDAALRLLDAVKPDVVVNCVGVIKQKSMTEADALAINAELPRMLARSCAARGARFIHFSTDCVFSGGPTPLRPRGYSEQHTPDPVDLYGHSKLRGEVGGRSCLTMRTSFIGREIEGHVSLAEWLFAQAGKSIRGYRGALYSGFSTTTMAMLVKELIQHQPDLSGIWHVGGEAISKFDLLQMLIQRGQLDIALQPDTEFQCDRRLDSTRFRQATGWVAPGWAEMVDQVLAQPRHRLR
jgi:dTDP-4-dehydrorhamnose reductase